MGSTWKLLRFLAFILPQGNVLSFMVQSSVLVCEKRGGRTERATQRLWASKRPTTASGQERREEYQRRAERAKDVVIGKTSAKPGETDFALDISATEEQWMRQATREEQEIFRSTEQGLEHLKMLRLEEADACFSKVFELKPNAYLWQAGIVKYYLNDLEGAASIFARTAEIYETRFLDPASEERIWRQASELKMISLLPKNKQKLIDHKSGIPGVTLAQIPARGDEDEFLATDTRKVIRTSRELFQSSIMKDHSAMILSRAKLRSIGGVFEEAPKIDVKKWKLYSWYYLGLHYDAVGEIKESKECMKMALRLSPTSTGQDLIHTLPTLHMKCRDWFDDGDYEADVRTDEVTAVSEHEAKAGTKVITNAEAESTAPLLRDVDPVVAESIRASLKKLRSDELKNALRLRGVRAIGSKTELQDSLFKSLMCDAGLIQGF